MPKTLLIADDSATIRKIVELTFRNTEVRVESVASGRDAMESWGAGQHDLVLVDVFMPDVSGYEICRSIKGSAHSVPVLLLAGTFEPFDLDLARECGADGHLIKPFESDALRAEVRSLLQRHETESHTLQQSRFQRAEADGSIDDLVEEIDELPPEPQPDPVERAAAFTTDDASPEESTGEPADDYVAELATGFTSDVADVAAETEEVAPEPPYERRVELRSEPEPERASVDDSAVVRTEGDAVTVDPAIVEAVVQAVLARLSEDVVRDVAHELVPEIAARIVRDRIREIEEHG